MLILKEGLKFTSKWFKGIVEILNFDGDKNDMEVQITSKEAGQWNEHWNLEHAIWGFENGDYKEIDPLLKQMSDWLMVNTSLDVVKIVDFCEHFKKDISEAKKMEKQQVNVVSPCVSGRLFPGVDFTTVNAEYMIGYDTYDDDQFCYILARKVGDTTEILLEKKHRMITKADKDQFEADVTKLAKYFNCSVVYGR